MSYKRVLVVVDVQRDFLDPAGSLYVAGGELVPERIAGIAGNYDAVVFTLDWHPACHCSFKNQGGIWPAHCVQYTQGAGLADCFADIMKEIPYRVYLKGCNPDREEYGAFEEMDDRLLALFSECEAMDFCGIAGDYCVKESIANALKYVPASKLRALPDCIASIDDGSTLDAFLAENGIAKA